LVPARVVDVAEVSTEDTDMDLLSLEVPVCFLLRPLRVLTTL